MTFRDTTPAIVATIAAARRKLEAEGMPPLGMHVLMGEGFPRLQINMMRAHEDGRVRSVEIVAGKPA